MVEMIPPHLPEVQVLFEQLARVVCIRLDHFAEAKYFPPASMLKGTWCLQQQHAAADLPSVAHQLHKRSCSPASKLSKFQQEHEVVVLPACGTTAPKQSCSPVARLKLLARACGCSRMPSCGTWAPR
eukprot:1160885-Pelagomonas_calceolata.AAC.9